MELTFRLVGEALAHWVGASFGKDLEEERAQQCNCYERSRERCGQRDGRCKGPAVGGSPACWRPRQEPRGWNTANRRAEESVYEGVCTFIFSVLDFLLRTLTSSLRCQSLVSRPDSVIVIYGFIKGSCLRPFPRNGWCGLALQIFGESWEFYTDHKKGKKKIGKY